MPTNRRLAGLASLIASLILGLVISPSRADDKAQPEMLPQPKSPDKSGPEKLPQPKSEMPVLIEPQPMPVMSFPPRRSYYAVWDLYGVTPSGQFRPRVIYSPHGAYYLYNGEPYPWVTTHSLEVMSFVVY
jgi:hypothetical protein